jgi:hypothetical protein
MSIFRTWPRNEEANAALSKFTGWFNMSCHEAAQWGNWWHYTKQALEQKKDLTDWRCDFGDLKPPRTMWTRVRAKYEGNRVTAVEPLEWTPFEMVQFYPTAFEAFVALRLGVEGGRDFEIEAVNWYPQKLGDSILAKIWPTRRDDVYYLEIALDKVKTIFGSGAEPRPRTGSKIETTLVKEGHPKDGFKMKGKVVEDHFEHKFDLCAIVLGFGNGQERLVEQDLTEDRYNVSIKFPSDPTSTKRQVAALYNILRRKTGREGLNASHIVFRTPAAGPIGPGFPGSMDPDSEARQTFYDASRANGLNPEQEEALANAAVHLFVHHQGPSRDWQESAPESDRPGPLRRWSWYGF